MKNVRNFYKALESRMNKLYVEFEMAFTQHILLALLENLK